MSGITRAARFNAKYNRPVPRYWCEQCQAAHPRIAYLGQRNFCAGCARRCDEFGNAVRAGLEAIAQTDPAAAERVADLFTGGQAR